MIALESVQVLEQEHAVIQRVIAALSILAERISQGCVVDPGLVSRAARFLGEYADRLHHAKEERALFPLLEQRGVPAAGCPLAVLRHEHQAGRTLVSELTDIAAAPDMDAPRRREQLVTLLQKLIKLYVEHIWKEDYLLVPMAGKVLSRADDQELSARYAAIDAEFGAGLRREFEESAAGLENSMLESARISGHGASQ